MSTYSSSRKAAQKDDGRCHSQLVDAGNALEDISQKTGDASGSVVVGGAVLATGGAALSVGGAPEAGAPVGAAGVGMMDAGAMGGLGAGALQFVGGVLQGLGGAGYSNATNALATLGTGALLAGMGKAAMRGANSASGRAAMKFIGTSNTFIGAGYDAMVNQFNQLGPQQKSCNRKD